MLVVGDWPKTRRMEFLVGAARGRAKTDMTNHPPIVGGPFGPPGYSFSVEGQAEEIPCSNFKVPILKVLNTL